MRNVVDVPVVSDRINVRCGDAARRSGRDKRYRSALFGAVRCDSDSNGDLCHSASSYAGQNEHAEPLPPPMLKSVFHNPRTDQLLASLQLSSFNVICIHSEKSASLQPKAYQIQPLETESFAADAVKR